MIALSTACDALAGFEDASGPMLQPGALHERISRQLKGQCPPRVTLRESDSSGISMFNPRTAEILISRNNRKPVNTVAHETVHLCMHRMSSGRVVDSIERRDADAAVKLMEQHLLTLEANVCVEAETPHNSLARMLGLQ